VFPLLHPVVEGSFNLVFYVLFNRTFGDAGERPSDGRGDGRAPSCETKKILLAGVFYLAKFRGILEGSFVRQSGDHKACRKATRSAFCASVRLKLKR
jgi:hypothetical protein